MAWAGGPLVGSVPLATAGEAAVLGVAVACTCTGASVVFVAVCKRVKRKCVLAEGKSGWMPDPKNLGAKLFHGLHPRDRPRCAELAGCTEAKAPTLPIISRRDPVERKSVSEEMCLGRWKCLGCLLSISTMVILSRRSWQH